MQLATSLVVILSSAAYAENRVYWTSRDKVQSSRLDGTDVTDVGSGFNTASGIAVDSNQGVLFWGDLGVSNLWSSRLDGSSAHKLFTPSVIGAVRDVELDTNAQKVYWADTYGISRSNYDGSGRQTIAANGSVVFAVTDFALDFLHGKIYWTEQSSAFRVRRANLDFSGIEDIATNLRLPGGVSVDPLGGRMYWADSAAGYIKSAKLDGSDLRTIVSGYDVHGVEVDPATSSIYWCETGPSYIRRANMDGSGIQTLVSLTRYIDNPLHLDIYHVPEPSALVLFLLGSILSSSSGTIRGATRLRFPV